MGPNHRTHAHKCAKVKNPHCSKLLKVPLKPKPEKSLEKEETAAATFEDLTQSEQEASESKDSFANPSEKKGKLQKTTLDIEADIAENEEQQQTKIQEDMEAIRLKWPVRYLFYQQRQNMKFKKQKWVLSRPQVVQKGRAVHEKKIKAILLNHDEIEQQPNMPPEFNTVRGSYMSIQAGISVKT